MNKAFEGNFWVSVRTFERGRKGGKCSFGAIYTDRKGKRDEPNKNHFLHKGG